MRRFLSGVLVCGLLAASACGGGGYSTAAGGSGLPTTPTPTPAATPANTVIATTGSSFDPTPLTVTPGTAVTFTFQGVAHNVFFDAAAGAPADISGSLSNVSETRTFSAAGTFGYQCRIHSGMRGTVIVR